MQALFAIYVFVAVLLLVTGAGGYFFAATDEDARDAARVALASLIWPVVLVVAAPCAIKQIVKDADLKNINKN